MAAPRILIIDDDLNILSTLRILFQREGFQVQTAFDGEDGLKKVFASGVDVILTDVNLPKMDGFQVFQKLKMQGVVQQIPILMMSAATTPVERAKFLEEGVEDFIPKPFNTIELLARVKRCLARAGAGGAVGVSSAGAGASTTRVGELTKGKLGDLQVVDLVQFFLMGQKEGLLEVSTPDSTARLFFVAGEIVHCTVSERSGICREGDDAVYAVLRMKDGNFRAAFDRVQMSKRIRTPTTELLMEHARRVDESSHKAAAAGTAAVPSPGGGPHGGSGGSTGGGGPQDDFSFGKP